jgi:hypothetical protein
MIETCDGVENKKTKQKYEKVDYRFDAQLISKPTSQDIQTYTCKRINLSLTLHRQQLALILLFCLSLQLAIYFAGKRILKMYS